MHLVLLVQTTQSVRTERKKERNVAVNVCLSLPSVAER